MSYFKAIARNDLGDTFVVHFYHQNWNGIRIAAEAALAAVVQRDPLHQKFGPWTIISIDHA